MPTKKVSVSLAVLAFAGACLGFAFTHDAASGPTTTAPGSRGVRLVFELHPATRRAAGPAVERTIAVMRSRARSMGVRGATIQRSGRARIVAKLPGVRDARRVADQLGARGQIRVLDWEANVLDADCRTNPRQVNGGQQPIRGLYRAVERASRCRPEPDGDTMAPALFYAFDKASRRPIGGGVPYESFDALSDALIARGRFPGAVVLKVPVGVSVLRAEDQRFPGERRGELNRWWVVRDDPILDGADIRSPEQGFDAGPGGAPIVTMRFSARGRAAFAEATRRIAQRGAENAARNGGLQDPVAASHHFAIRLDDEVISTPYVNFAEHPAGIDGERGVEISGGFTIQGAKDLAALLALPALPARLHLVSARRE